MALIGTEAEPLRSAKRFGYAIKMMSSDQIVPVIVTDEGLQDIASPPDASPERLSLYRSAIAFARSIRGDYRFDGASRSRQ
jgi:hypothetical protein